MDEVFAPVETPRLILRGIKPADAATLSERMTPGVARWVASWPSPLTLELAAQRIELMRLRASEGSMLPMAVVKKDGDELIGLVSVSRHHEDSRRGVFGYWLGERHHQKGYMTEIAPVIIHTAFERLNLDIIEAAAQLANEPSFKVMEAAGMKPSGEGMVYAPSRGHEELCRFYEITRIRPTHH